MPNQRSVPTKISAAFSSVKKNNNKTSRTGENVRNVIKKKGWGKRIREQETKLRGMQRSVPGFAGRKGPDRRPGWARGKDERELTRRAVDVFTDEYRDAEMHGQRRSFTSHIIEHFDMTKIRPEDIVQEARVYFRRRYEEQKAVGRERKCHWLHSCSNAVSKTKLELRKLKMAPYRYTVQVRLTEKEIKLLDRMSHRRLEENARYLHQVDGTVLLQGLLRLLESDEPLDVVVAVCGLSGRRQSEVMHSAKFDEPKRPMQHRYPSFWAHTTGFIKQKAQDRYAVTARELPLLAPRDRLQRALLYLRDHFPSDDHRHASRLYGAKIAAHVKKVLRPLGVEKLHELRKTFALLAYGYFNETNSSLPAFASSVLGHKRIVSSKVLTYLSVQVDNMPSMQWLLLNTKSGLRHDRPEKEANVGKKEIITPTNTDSEPDEPDELDEPDEPNKGNKLEDRKNMQDLAQFLAIKM
jgi:hypothetical protein